MVEDIVESLVDLGVRGHTTLEESFNDDVELELSRQSWAQPNVTRKALR